MRAFGREFLTQVERKKLRKMHSGDKSVGELMTEAHEDIYKAIEAVSDEKWRRSAEVIHGAFLRLVKAVVADVELPNGTCGCVPTNAYSREAILREWGWDKYKKAMDNAALAFQQHDSGRNPGPIGQRESLRAVIELLKLVAVEIGWEAQPFPEDFHDDHQSYPEDSHYPGDRRYGCGYTDQRTAAIASRFSRR